MGFDFDKLAGIRRDYGERPLKASSLPTSPFVLFEAWFDEILSLEEILDPNAMVLSTVDQLGHPNSRVVLLKGVELESFLFYTNYHSTKGQELERHPYAALNFFWPVLSRQIRIRGRVTKLSHEASEQYFSSRSLESQCSAIVSPQSHPIDSRDDLVKAMQSLMTKQQAEGGSKLSCPDYWGGFSLRPDEFEFWQGRNHRLHDRFRYHKVQSQWCSQRLAS